MLIEARDLDHPAEAGPRAGSGGTDALQALLGASRAALLHDLVRPRTTSELATRHGLAVGTVSGHLSILARTRLVSAQRRGRKVFYLRTPLGSLLVDAPPGAEPQG
jgi:DNA-binding transcriptional ArsR family regulator